jgi:arginase
MAKTLRLIMPQWQGGNNPSYSLGAKLLAWLAPENEYSRQIEVPIEAYNGNSLIKEGGVAGRSVILKQMKAATRIIEEYKPEKIIVFGGDCHISQAPFAYLNKKYKGKLGILWLDAHPDISTPEMHNHEHAMVLGNLLGEGDPVFSAEVEVPIDPRLVMYVGLQETTKKEMEIIKRFKLRKASGKELSQIHKSITEWIKKEKIEYLAVHLDLDVLDPKQFRSLLFNNPDGTHVDAPSGVMSLDEVGSIISGISRETEIVGFSIAEYIPWDVINLKNFLESLPVFE